MYVSADCVVASLVPADDKLAQRKNTIMNTQHITKQSTVKCSKFKVAPQNVTTEQSYGSRDQSWQLLRH